MFLKRWEDDVFISVCLSVRLSVRQNYSKNCHKLSSIFWRVGSYYKESSIRLLWWSGPESGRLSDTTVLPHSPGDVLFLINLFPLMIKSTLLCCKLIPSFPKSTQSSNVVLYRKVGKMQHRLHCLRVTPGFHHYATRSTAPQTFSVRQKRRKKSRQRKRLRQPAACQQRLHAGRIVLYFYASPYVPAACRPNCGALRFGILT